MRALRSRTTTTSTSDASINTTLTKVTKKTGSRKTKQSLTKNSTESSSDDNVFKETEISTDLKEDLQTLKKNRRTRKPKVDINDKDSKLFYDKESKLNTDCNKQDLEMNKSNVILAKKDKSMTINKTVEGNNTSISENINSTFDLDGIKSKGQDISLKIVSKLSNTRKFKNGKRTRKLKVEKHVSKYNEERKNIEELVCDNETKLNSNCNKTDLKPHKSNVTSAKKSSTIIKNNQSYPSIIDETTVEGNNMSVSENINSTFDLDDIKSEDKDISMKNMSKLSDTQKFMSLVKQESSRYTTNLDHEKFPEEMLKIDISSSSGELNKTLTIDQDCIVIDDSININNSVQILNDKSPNKVLSHKNPVKNETFEKNSTIKEKNTTFEKKCTNNNTNTTFEKVNVSFSEKLEDESSRRGTYYVNGSGQWSVEDILAEYLEETKNNSIDEDRITLHKKQKSKILQNETFNTPNDSSRKKWVKFQTNEIKESPILRKSLFRENLPKICSSTPYENKYPVTPAILDRSGKRNNSTINQIKSTTKSNKKSTIKAKAMPNFALIHKKANEKIESIVDYSERKKERAEKLLSGEKVDDKENQKKSVIKSSVDLFGNLQSNNKSKTPKKLAPSGILNKTQSNKKESTKREILILKRKEFISKLPQLKSQFKSKSVLTINQSNTSKTDVASKTFNSSSKYNKSNILKSEKSASNVFKSISFNKPSASGNKRVPTYSKSSFTLNKPITEIKEQLKLPLTAVNKTETKHQMVEHKPVSVFSKGFIFNKSKTEKNEPSKVEQKPVSVFSKGHCIALANKTKTTDKLGNRDNRRDQLIGVRTNRRFDLLMQMRNNLPK